MATQFMDILFSPMTGAVVGIGIVAGAYYAARKSGYSSIGTTSLSTEEALSMYSVLGGLGGAASQIIGSKRLSAVEKDSVKLSSVLPALLVTIGASAGSALLLPS